MGEVGFGGLRGEVFCEVLDDGGFFEMGEVEDGHEGEGVAVFAVGFDGRAD